MSSLEMVSVTQRVGEDSGPPRFRVVRPFFSFYQVVVVAQNTVREATRQRLFNFVALLAFVLVAGAQWLRDLNFGSSELKFLADFGFGAMAFFGAALTIVATAQLFFSEIEHRTALTLLAKPIRRAEFLAGKFTGIAFVTAVFCSVLLALLMAVLWWRETALMRAFPDAFDRGRALDYAALIGAGFAQWLKLTMLSALTLMVASFARTQLFTTAAGFMILVICHLQFLAQTAAERSSSAGALSFAWLLSVVLPNFQLFDFADSIGAGDGLDWGQLSRLTLYTGAYVVSVCAFASFAFRRREI